LKGTIRLTPCGLCDHTRAPLLADAYLDTTGLRLHYVAAWQGELILFLHGFPEFWYAWKNQLAEFHKDHHAVALDLPGYSLSDKPEEASAYEIDHIVEDVCAFARHLSRGKTCVLVGHDWGGYVA
jgi:epoxide hydrolase 4